MSLGSDDLGRLCSSSPVSPVYKPLVLKKVAEPDD